jgi:hypothetical protein
LGTACQYEEAGQALLAGTLSDIGLPNFAPYSFFPFSNAILSLGNDTVICPGDAITLKLDIPPSCEASFNWFDQTQGPEKMIFVPGTYWVEVSGPCLNFRDTIVIAESQACMVTCGGTFAKVLGVGLEVERGYSIAASVQEDVLYIGGLINDSVAIAKITPDGDVIWVRTFDIVPERSDHLRKILIDSEGMIVVSGVAGGFNALGTVFAFRYDPIQHQMLWAKQYISHNADYTFGFIEMTPGGDYLMTNNPHLTGHDDCQLIQLHRTTGNVVSSLSKNYHLGASDELNDLVIHQGQLFASGRFTDGPDNRDMRNTLTRINLTTGIPDWMILGHVPISVPARLYGSGMSIFNDEIYSISTGDEDGTSIDFTDNFMQKTTLDGVVKWINKYDLPGNSDVVDEIIKSPNGFLIFARTRLVPGDIFLYEVDMVVMSYGPGVMILQKMIIR